MRIGFVTDLHLGAGTSLAADRLADQTLAVEWIGDIFEREHVDLILFGGDAWHRRRPTPAEYLALEPLLTASVPVIAIPGNHDVVSPQLPSSLEVIQHRLMLHRTPCVAWQGGVAVCALPWAPVSTLVANLGGGDRDDISRLAAERLMAVARGLYATASEGGADATILLPHWSISDAVTPNGTDVGLFREPVLPLAELEQIGFDYILAGHIHKPQLLHGCNATGPVLYGGSPYVVDWGEADSEHGVWVIDTDHASTPDEPDSFWFHHVPDRPFVKLHTDLTEPGNDDVIAEILNGDHSSRDRVSDGAVVRFTYTGTREQLRRVDGTAVRDAFLRDGAHRAFVIPDTVTEQTARVEGLDDTISEADAAELWMRSQVEAGTVTAETAARALTLAPDYTEAAR